MATNAVDICNSALIKLGAGRITSLSDDSKAGKLCNEQYDKIRKQLLRSHPWNFAIRRKALTKTANTPAYKYSSEFLLPTDCLRVLETNLDEYSIPDSQSRSTSAIAFPGEWGN